jgi:hypothetical protein
MAYVLVFLIGIIAGAVALLGLIILFTMLADHTNHPMFGE